MSAITSSTHRSGKSRRRRSLKKDDTVSVRKMRVTAGFLGLLVLALLASLGVIAATASQ
ncbi:hypothetical protein MUN84_11995 [Hymenobacter sp. 5516J-16]|uniref:Uncharacterized protein n=1 Tax=Hymenobacter sublimis TaxID=2933777 RepID=A0ABY4JB87_9BACT|nr:MULTISPECIES: hypothetical protein [Hymenobacter]UOQ75436.1 hypothetical protein MUN84_11995 [Hymenobacter sp. 5516J-16]UPL49114.1 hypothetical protein MWH26_18235 [Hymenobacter sublimis]